MGERMTHLIAGHYCGQTQPHAAHTWQTPPTYGSAAFISTYQCAGTTGEMLPATVDHTEVKVVEDVEALAERITEYVLQCVGQADPHEGVQQMLAAHDAALSDTEQE